MFAILEAHTWHVVKQERASSTNNILQVRIIPCACIRMLSSLRGCRLRRHGRPHVTRAILSQAIMDWLVVPKEENKIKCQFVALARTIQRVALYWGQVQHPSPRRHSPAPQPASGCQRSATFISYHIATAHHWLAR